MVALGYRSDAPYTYNAVWKQDCRCELAIEGSKVHESGRTRHNTVEGKKTLTKLRYCTVEVRFRYCCGTVAIPCECGSKYA